MIVGVLALQGDFAEHLSMLNACGVDSIAIKRAHELDQINGLIIPGGESTTIAELTQQSDDTIFDIIHKRVKDGMPVYGTCMGSIFLAADIENSSQGRLGLMDIKIKRNAFGPQRHSFESDLNIPTIGPSSFQAIFIRAPIIVSCGTSVDVLCQTQDGIVMARQDNMLVTAFHPELTNDRRIHYFFLKMIEKSNNSSKSSAIQA